MKRIQIIFEALSLLVVVICAQAQSGETPIKPAVQIEVERIQQMQNQPDDFHVPDWKKITDGFTDLAFDLGAKGEYMPLVWIDTNHINYPEDAFGQFVVVGDSRGGLKMANGTYYIASGSIAAVISATLVGHDMTNYKGRNWVRMCLAFFNKANGRNVFMEHVKEFDGQSVGGCYDFDFWGDVLPSQLAIELSSLYPGEHEFDEPLKLTADRFTDAVGILLSTPEKFAWSTFDWKTMKPVKNFIPGERDAAGGMGAFLYLAYQRFGDPKYLDASFRCLNYLESLDKNPIYSCMIAYGPLAMAKANAENGKNYDVTRQLKWCFEGGAVCVEGVHAGKWGDYDMSGLVEMQGCKRVYAMETFLWAKQLVPLPRYDARFARVIGKWMMNAASNTRYFYPDYLPKTNQVAPEYAKLTRGVIGTEAITAKSMYGDRPVPTAETDKWETKNPDGTPSVRPLASNYSLYGSSHVGIYGGIIHRISSDTGETIALDCLKTDFLHAKAYPTWLVYNPTFKEQRLKMQVGSEPVDIYDTVTHSYLKRNVSGTVKVPLPADSAAVLVYIPTGGNETHEGSHFLVNGVVVDWSCQN